MERSKKRLKKRLKKACAKLKPFSPEYSLEMGKCETIGCFKQAKYMVVSLEDKTIRYVCKKHLKIKTLLKNVSN